MCIKATNWKVSLFAGTYIWRAFICAKGKYSNSKVDPEIEKTIHERGRPKELIKHYLTSLAIKEIVLLRWQKHCQ